MIYKHLTSPKSFFKILDDLCIIRLYRSIFHNKKSPSGGIRKGSGQSGVFPLAFAKFAGEASIEVGLGFPANNGHQGLSGLRGGFRGGIRGFGFEEAVHWVVFILEGALAVVVELYRELSAHGLATFSNPRLHLVFDC